MRSKGKIMFNNISKLLNNNLQKNIKYLIIRFLKMLWAHPGYHRVAMLQALRCADRLSAKAEELPRLCLVTIPQRLCFLNKGY